MSDILTPVQAIKQFCIDCSGGSYNEAKLCPNKDCPLYPYRLGKKPKKDGPKRVLSEEHLQKLKEGRKKKNDSSGND